MTLSTRKLQQALKTELDMLERADFPPHSHQTYFYFGIKKIISAQFCSYSALVSVFQVQY